jgi:acetyl esterase/lipase
MTIHKDICYSKIGSNELHLDVYLPEQTVTPMPVLIWIHGGGWRAGERGLKDDMLRPLENGFAMVAASYRLSSEAIFPAQLQDCRTAVRWVRSQAGEYGFDPDRIGAWGSSAGGHLVALLGVTGATEEFDTAEYAGLSSEVQAVCDWFGPTDFLRMNDFPGAMDHDAADSPESQLIGGAIQENTDLVSAANPISHISSRTPPFLIVHGSEDRLVPHHQSELLQSALKSAGADATLYTVEGGDHGFTGAEKDTRSSLILMATDFFAKCLG